MGGEAQPSGSLGGVDPGGRQRRADTPDGGGVVVLNEDEGRTRWPLAGTYQPPSSPIESVDEALDERLIVSGDPFDPEGQQEIDASQGAKLRKLAVQNSSYCSAPRSSRSVSAPSRLRSPSFIWVNQYACR
jgi:hypothetical protein